MAGSRCGLHSQLSGPPPLSFFVRPHCAHAMIERTTGQIQLPSDGIRVGPSLSREQFVASPFAGQCREIVRNEPHCSFALPTVQFEDHSFAWSLSFRGSVLQRVSIRSEEHTSEL